MPSVRPRRYSDYYGRLDDPPEPAVEPVTVRSYQFNITCPRCRGTLQQTTPASRTTTSSAAIVQCTRCNTRHLIRCTLTDIDQLRAADNQHANLGQLSHHHQNVRRSLSQGA